MSKSALAALLSEACSSEKGDHTESLSLDELYASYTTKQPLAVGDKVRWKKGLLNRRGGRDQEFIGVKAFEVPVFNSEDSSGSAYFREPLTIRAGTIKQGTFVIYYLDGDRLEKVA